MKKKIIVVLFLLAYTLFYKLYLSYQGQIITYIINPIIWIILAFISHYTFPKIKKRIDTNILVPSITVISLLYIIIYYSLGLVVGYTNNPYATDINGIIINLFSLLLIVCIKEYIRYLFMNVRIRQHRILYYTLVFIVFLIIDISLINIIKTSNLLNLWVNELLVPVIINLLMMYIVYVSDYKAAVVFRIIMIMPTLIFRVIPDYNWFAVIIFNIIFCLVTYLLIQYTLNKMDNSTPLHLTSKFHPTRWIVSTIIIFIVISFGAGFFNVKPVVILSGSMEPSIKPGDMVIIDTADINDITKGDIIEFKVLNNSVIHRVVKIVYENGNRRYITKGDANKKEDKYIVTDSQVIGKYIFNIPYIGYPTYLIKNIVNTNDEISTKRGEISEEK